MKCTVGFLVLSMVVLMAQPSEGFWHFVSKQLDQLKQDLKQLDQMQQDLQQLVQMQQEQQEQQDKRSKFAHRHFH
uniref:Moronecidin-like n=1 Tax=Kryptolebias marmoratus TaxID=37003 RepID=A0A3Q3BNY8_KRYMA